LKGSLASAIAHKAVVVSQLYVVAVDLDRRQAICTHPSVRRVLSLWALGELELKASQIVPYFRTSPAFLKELSISTRVIHLCSEEDDHMGFGRGALLWLLGVPLPIIILLALFWHH
jgi:hypothetical protein